MKTRYKRLIRGAFIPRRVNYLLLNMTILITMSAAVRTGHYEKLPPAPEAYRQAFEQALKNQSPETALETANSWKAKTTSAAEPQLYLAAVYLDLDVPALALRALFKGMSSYPSEAQKRQLLELKVEALSAVGDHVAAARLEQKLSPDAQAPRAWVRAFIDMHSPIAFERIPYRMESLNVENIPDENTLYFACSLLEAMDEQERAGELRKAFKETYGADDAGDPFAEVNTALAPIRKMKAGEARNQAIRKKVLPLLEKVDKVPYPALRGKKASNLYGLKFYYPLEKALKDKARNGLHALQGAMYNYLTRKSGKLPEKRLEREQLVRAIQTPEVADAVTYLQSDRADRLHRYRADRLHRYRAAAKEAGRESQAIIVNTALLWCTEAEPELGNAEELAEAVADPSVMPELRALGHRILVIAKEGYYTPLRGNDPVLAKDTMPAKELAALISPGRPILPDTYSYDAKLLRTLKIPCLAYKAEPSAEPTLFWQASKNQAIQLEELHLITYRQNTSLAQELFSQRMEKARSKEDRLDAVSAFSKIILGGKHGRDNKEATGAYLNALRPYIIKRPHEGGPYLVNATASGLKRGSLLPYRKSLPKNVQKQILAYADVVLNTYNKSKAKQEEAYRILDAYPPGSKYHEMAMRTIASGGSMADLKRRIGIKQRNAAIERHNAERARQWRAQQERNRQMAQQQESYRERKRRKWREGWNTTIGAGTPTSHTGSTSRYGYNYTERQSRNTMSMRQWRQKVDRSIRSATYSYGDYGWH